MKEWKRISCVFLLITLSSLAAETNPVYELQSAAQDGDLNKVKRLLKAGTDVNAPGVLEDFREYSFKKNALIWAAVMGHVDVVKYLVEAGANLEARDEYQQTALFAAAKRGHADVVKYLLSKGADPKVTVFGSNAIVYGIQFPAIVDMLAKSGTDVNQMSEFQQTPLMAAAAGGHVETLQILLKHGAKVDLQFADKSEGRTALMQAVQNQQYETSEILLQRGASIALKDKGGATIFDIAARYGNEKIRGLVEKYRHK